MSRRLRALRGLVYPADADSVALVKRAGGLSKMSPEQRKRIKLRQVPAGAFCDDAPKSSIGGLLRKHAVEWVDVGGAAEHAGSGTSDAVPPASRAPRKRRVIGDDDDG